MVRYLKLAQECCERSGQGGRVTTRDGSIWWRDVAKGGYRKGQGWSFAREWVVIARNGI